MMMQEEEPEPGHLGDDGSLWNRHCPCLSGAGQHEPGDVQSNEPAIRPGPLSSIILHELYIDTGYIGMPCESGQW